MTRRRVSNTSIGSQFQIPSFFSGWPLIPLNICYPEYNTFITRIILVTRCKNQKWILAVGFHSFQNKPSKTYIVYSLKESGYWSNLETYNILSQQQHFTETSSCYLFRWVTKEPLVVVFILTY